MPNIMRCGGINVLEDVVKIRDVLPADKLAAKKAARARAKEASAEGEDGLQLEGMQESLDEEFEEFSPDEMSEEASQEKQGDALQAEAITKEIVQSAMAQAAGIIEQAVDEAKKTRENALLGIDEQAEAIRRQAEQEGRQQGAATLVESTENIVGRIEESIAVFEGERRGFEAEYEEQLRWMAMEIAAKVLDQKVSEDDAILTGMVQKAVQSVRSEQWIRIEVAQEMTRLLASLSELYEDVANVELSAVPAAAGTVNIETPSGVLDASMHTQLKNLKQYFDTPQA